MITKDQIKQSAIARGFKLSNENGDDLKPYVYEFARDIIALAQEVRPLVWERRCVTFPLGPDGYLLAETVIGKYSIHKSPYPRTAIMKFFFSGPEFDKPYTPYKKEYSTESEAIAAAQADFNRRVLENLTHGVADEKVD